MREENKLRQIANCYIRMNTNFGCYRDIREASITDVAISIFMKGGFLDEMLLLSCPVFTYVFELEPVLVETFTDWEPENTDECTL